MLFEHHVSKRLCFTSLYWPISKKTLWFAIVNLHIFQKHYVLKWIIDVFRRLQNHCKTQHFWKACLENRLFYNEFGRSRKPIRKSTPIFGMFQKPLKTCVCVFFCLNQKRAVVDSFIKMGAVPWFTGSKARIALRSWLRWAGLGWLAGWLAGWLFQRFS